MTNESYANFISETEDFIYKSWQKWSNEPLEDDGFKLSSLLNGYFTPLQKSINEDKYTNDLPEEQFKLVVKDVMDVLVEKCGIGTAYNLGYLSHYFFTNIYNSPEYRLSGLFGFGFKLYFEYRRGFYVNCYE